MQNLAKEQAQKYKNKQTRQQAKVCTSTCLQRAENAVPAGAARELPNYWENPSRVKGNDTIIKCMISNRVLLLLTVMA